MRYLYPIFLVTLFLFSCDDGDVAVTNFNFDTSANVLSCNNVLYKIKSNELLYLSLPVGTFKNEKTEIDKPIQLPINSINLVAYRQYNTPVTTNSFCATVTPANLIVTGEWIALEGVADQTGLIQIVSTEVIDRTTGAITGYNHEIRLIKTIFANGFNQFVFENYLVGTYTTTL